MLQASEIGLGTYSGAADRLKLVYTYGATNNGNVQTQQIIAPSVNRTQTYTYDGVNRLTAASESGGSWSQSYGYDAYGNRWLVGAAFPTPSQQSHFEYFGRGDEQPHYGGFGAVRCSGELDAGRLGVGDDGV